MNTHIIHLHPEPYAAVSSGRKTVESRLYDAKRRQINLGDELVFESRQDPTATTRTRVVGLQRYGTFADLFNRNDPAKFGGEDAATLLAEVREFYSAADEADAGVIGIEFERLT
jgi:ASC-1-like (ASCH) protein